MCLLSWAPRQLGVPSIVVSLLSPAAARWGFNRWGFSDLMKIVHFGGLGGPWGAAQPHKMTDFPANH